MTTEKRKQIKKALADIGELSHLKWLALVGRARKGNKFNNLFLDEFENFELGLAEQYIDEQQNNLSPPTIET